MTPAAVAYVVALICGGLGVLSFFVFPHTLPVVMGCAAGVLVGLGGALFAVRSLKRELTA